MDQTIFRATLDIHDIYSKFTISIKKGDTSGKLIITLTENGKPYQITEDCYAVFVGAKSNGSILHNGCTVHKNTIIYDFTKETTSTVGKIDCEVVLYGEHGQEIISPRFTIKVFDTVYSEELVEASNEFTSLSQLISTAKALIDETTERFEKGEFKGDQGEQGAQGEKGEQGDQGVGIDSIKLTSVVGLNKTYKITLENGKSYTFTVADGAKGAKGDKGEKGADGTMSFTDLTDEQREGLKGAAAGFGEPTATAEMLPVGEDPIVTVVADPNSPDTKKVFRFDFKIPQGEKGEPGNPGEPGKDGVFEDLTEDQKESLKGNPGDSAYDIWLDNGYEGTEQEFLEWIKGDPGGQGEKGEKGDKGDTPIKGQDYFTEEDKKELVDSVISSFPTWDGSTSEPPEDAPTNPDTPTEPDDPETPTPDEEEPEDTEGCFVTDKGKKIDFNMQIIELHEYSPERYPVHYLFKNTEYGGDIGALELETSRDVVAQYLGVDEYNGLMAYHLPAETTALGQNSFILNLAPNGAILDYITTEYYITFEGSKEELEALLAPTTRTVAEGVKVVDAFVADYGGIDVAGVTEKLAEIRIFYGVWGQEGSILIFIPVSDIYK